MLTRGTVGAGYELWTVVYGFECRSLSGEDVLVLVLWTGEERRGRKGEWVLDSLAQQRGLYTKVLPVAKDVDWSIIH